MRQITKPIGPLLVVAMAYPVKAQELLYEIVGRGPSVLHNVAPVGDVNGDSIPEFVFGGYGPFGVGGMVALVDGLTGVILQSALGPGDYQFGEVVEGVGDFDGDGIPDYASGIPDDGPGSFDGEVRVWSGATGEELALISGSHYTDEFFGRAVEWLGDVDGDGFDDIAVAWGSAPDVLILGGPDGHLIRRHHTGVPASLANIGDVDGDGVFDYVLAAVGYMVFVHSGATGVILYSLPDYFDNISFGRAVVGMGDLDGDGTPDFAASGNYDHACQETRQGWIRFYSGKDGSFLWQHSSTKANDAWAKKGCTYYWLEGGEDVNGDGVLDFMTRGRNTHPHMTWSNPAGHHTAVHSGRTGTMLWRQFPGWGGEFLGDVDGDGLSEWIHGNYIYDRHQKGTPGGRVSVYRGFAGDAERICVANPNSTGEPARLLLDGPISIGNNELFLSIENGIPGEVAVFFYGREQVFQPFGDGTLCVGSGTLGHLRIGSPITLDADGYGSMQVDMTMKPMDKGPSAWKPGRTWFLQAWYRDPLGITGFNLTDAWQVTFVN